MRPNCLFLLLILIPASTSAQRPSTVTVPEMPRNPAPVDTAIRHFPPWEVHEDLAERSRSQAAGDIRKIIELSNELVNAVHDSDQKTVFKNASSIASRARSAWRSLNYWKQKWPRVDPDIAPTASVNEEHSESARRIQLLAAAAGKLIALEQRDLFPDISRRTDMSNLLRDIYRLSAALKATTKPSK